MEAAHLRQMSGQAEEELLQQNQGVLVAFDTWNGDLDMWLSEGFRDVMGWQVCACLQQLAWCSVHLARNFWILAWDCHACCCSAAAL